MDDGDGLLKGRVLISDRWQGLQLDMWVDNLASRMKHSVGGSD